METQEESSSEAYKKALEKMKVQTLQLREKLKELENGEGLKKVIEDQDIKIQLLSKEKSRLNSCISQLRDSLKEQNDTINHLKNLISTPKPGNNQYSTPSRDLVTYKNYLEHDENDIHQEIANLDSEIQLLQNSLKQALITN
jgi:chromosome segregation ATPase